MSLSWELHSLLRRWSGTSYTSAGQRPFGRPGSGADHPYKKQMHPQFGGNIHVLSVEGILRVQVVTKEVWQMEFGRIWPIGFAECLATLQGPGRPGVTNAECQAFCENNVETCFIHSSKVQTSSQVRAWSNKMFVGTLLFVAARLFFSTPFFSS